MMTSYNRLVIIVYNVLFLPHYQMQFLSLLLQNCAELCRCGESQVDMIWVLSEETADEEGSVSEA